MKKKNKKKKKKYDSYLEFLECKLNSKNYQNNASEEEIKETKRKYDRERLLQRLLKKK